MLSTRVVCVVAAGLTWLPGLPQQVLQVLSEVLQHDCFHRLLAACLAQPGRLWLKITAAHYQGWAMHLSLYRLHDSVTVKAIMRLHDTTHMLCFAAVVQAPVVASCSRSGR